MKFSKEQVENLVLSIIGQADYDIYKSFVPETSEDMKYAKEELNQLVKFTSKILKQMIKESESNNAK